MKESIKIPGIQACPIIDVAHIEGKGNYCVIHLKNGNAITMAKTLKKFEAQLRLHPFIRIHKSYLVNKTFVKPFDQKQATELLLSTGISLPVSRRKLDMVRKSFQ